MKKAFLILVFIISSAVVAEGDDWVFVTQNNDGSEYYIDSSSIKEVSPDNFRAWTMTKPSSTDPLKTQDNKDVEKTEELLHFDCSDNRFRIVQRTLYFTDGTNANRPSTDWMYIIPGSVVKEFLDSICITRRESGEEN